MNMEEPSSNYLNYTEEIFEHYNYDKALKTVVVHGQIYTLGL